MAELVHHLSYNHEELNVVPEPIKMKPVMVVHLPLSATQVVLCMSLGVDHCQASHIKKKSHALVVWKPLLDSFG